MEMIGARQHVAVRSTKKNRCTNNFPPTQAALRAHVKRSVYQGGHILGQACVASLHRPESNHRGLTKNAKEQWDLM